MKRHKRVQLIICWMTTCLFFAGNSVEIKYGFIGKNGSFVIDAQYDNALDFSDDRAVVVKNGEEQVIDTSGEVVFKTKHDLGLCFSEGLISFRPKNTDVKEGFMDKNGNIVIEALYDIVGEFYEGLVCVTKNGKWGYIDHKGNVVIDFKFRWINNFASQFSSGYATICLGEVYVYREKIDEDYPVKHQIYGYINRKGDVMGKARYSSVGSFTEGLAVAEIGGYSIIKSAEKHIDGKYGFIDLNFKWKIKPKFQDAYGFNEGLAPVKFDDKWGFIDKKGKFVIKPSYEWAVTKFHDGLAGVQQDDKYGFIDKKGKVIIPIKFDNVSFFSEGFAAVKVGDCWGYIDKTGKYLVEPVMEKAYPFSNGLARVKIALDQKLKITNKDN